MPIRCSILFITFLWESTSNGARRALLCRDKKKLSFHRHWTSGLFILFSVVVSSLVTEALAIWIPTSRQHKVDLGQISLVGTFPSHDWTRSPYIYAKYSREFGTALMAWTLLHRLQRAGRVSFPIATQSVVPRTATKFHFGYIAFKWVAPTTEKSWQCVRVDNWLTFPLGAFK